MAGGTSSPCPALCLPTAPRAHGAPECCPPPLATPPHAPAEELRTAAEYDFETALSPRASYHTRDDPFACSFGPLHGGDWLRSSEGLLGLEGSAEGSVPRGVAGEAREAEGLQEEEEGEEPLVRGEGTGRLCGSGSLWASCPRLESW